MATRKTAMGQGLRSLGGFVAGHAAASLGAWCRLRDASVILNDTRSGCLGFGQSKLLVRGAGGGA